MARTDRYSSRLHQRGWVGLFGQLLALAIVGFLL
jgi:hypothetical protein